MNPVLSSLLPVMLLIAIGFIAGKLRWIRPEATKDLSNLVFFVLTAALLFRTMSRVHIGQLDFKPVAVYFAVAGFLFFALLAVWGMNSRAAVLALASIFSNNVMIGIPLVALAYGDQALVLLFTLISLHSLVLLTTVTVVLELLQAHEMALAGTAPQQHRLRMVWQAVKSAIIHPVPMPIIAGLLFSLTGWSLPDVVDRPLLLLGNAFGPVALLLVGITLAQVSIRGQIKGAVLVAGIKTLVHPLLMALAGLALGMHGQSLIVLVVAAALPVGANVFLFSQRYEKAQELVTASMAVSTLLALLSVSLVMMLAPRFLS
ncbi:putative transporter YfdV [mine drainage metagenome]|uniref:Putative transporter YfdV n=1 Tax=mine drainage metagenome TaxID=410659 RepID=A0A1J5PTP3_9ZZZZ